MKFCFRNILQIWIILIGFRDTNDFVNLGICKHEFKFTCRGYCRFILTTFVWGTDSMYVRDLPSYVLILACFTIFKGNVFVKMFHAPDFF